MKAGQRKGNDYRLIVAIAYRFRMEQGGLTANDLEPMIGRRNRVYEILNRKRGLTLQMTWNLHKGLGIPAESLVNPPGVSLISPPNAGRTE